METDQNNPEMEEGNGLPAVPEAEGTDTIGTDISEGAEQGAETVETEVELERWTSIFPKEQLEKYKDLLMGQKLPKDLLEKYADLTSKSGNAITPPDENASEEEIRSYLTTLGVPESSDGYELKQMTEEAAENLGDVSEFNSWFKEQAHKLDMTKAQAEQFYEGYLQRIGERATEQGQAKEKLDAERQAALEKEWGDNIDSNFELAKRAVLTFADDELKGLMSETGLAEDPRMIKLFYNISQKIGGDSFEYGSLSGRDPEVKGLQYPAIRKKYPVSEE